MGGESSVVSRFEKTYLTGRTSGEKLLSILQSLGYTSGGWVTSEGGSGRAVLFYPREAKATMGALMLIDRVLPNAIYNNKYVGALRNPNVRTAFEVAAQLGVSDEALVDILTGGT